MTAPKENLIVGGGKSVFEDLGIPMSPADMLKVNLAAFASRIIQDKGMTQAEAAKTLGIDQPKVSKLLRGRLQEFSIERLLGFVLALGHPIDVKIGSDAKTKRHVKLAA
jgi:predicted XRE-type DNA-binding protein